MKTWKRDLLIAYVACSVLVIVFYCVYVFGSDTLPFFKFLLCLPCVGAAVGACVGVYLIGYAFIHEHATLQAGPGGSINIERSALESTSRRALAGISGVTVQRANATVIARKAGPIIDISVTAVPQGSGSGSLMDVAGRIQDSVKQAVEAFTGHEVRYVSVNFVEGRGRFGKGDPQPQQEPEVGAPSFIERMRERVAIRRAEAARNEDVVETPATVLPNDGAETDAETPATAVGPACGESAVGGGVPATDRSADAPRPNEDKVS